MLKRACKPATQLSFGVRQLRLIVESFEYTQTYGITEKDYADIHAISSRRSKPWRILLLIIVGLSCLLWSFTLIVGIGLLCIATISIFAPHVFPWSMNANFRGHAHLHQPLTFSITEQGMRVSGPHLDLRCEWPNLTVWREHEGWLRLSPHGMQDLYFRTSGLH